MATDHDEPLEGEVVDETAGANLPAVRASEAIMARGELTVLEVVAQKDKIVEIMQAVMTEGVHYGRIPGIDKPSLFKPGAEAINVALRLAPDYESERMFDGNHLTVVAKCVLRHIPTSLIVAAGEGLCSSRESRYATRKAKRKCPTCGKETIIKGKAEYGGGWVCWRKAGKSDGCGEKFEDGDQRIEAQVEGTVENPELPDTWNTVLKMADKRALIAAVLNGTAASDVFTQDVEDTAARESEREGDGAGASGSSGSSSERVVDRQAYPVPKSWPEIEKGIRAADNSEEAWALFEAFIRAAAYHLFGQADSSALTQEQKTTMAQKSAGVVVWLHEHVEYEGPFLFFDEDRQRRAWAAMLDGGPALAIPDYVPPEPPAPEPPDPDLERERAEAP